MKKQLSLLLLVPFLLMGCNTNESSEEKKAGEQGDPILTQEEIDKLTMKTLDKYESKQTKVGTVTIPHDATDIDLSAEGQLISYTLQVEEAKKLEIMSLVKCGSVFSIADLTKYKDWGIDYVGGSPYLESAVIELVTHDEVEDEDTYHYTIVDAIGTKLLELDSEEEKPSTAFSVNSFAIDVSEYKSNINSLRTVYSVVSYFDEKTAKNVEAYYKYDANYSKAEKVTDIYEKEALVNNNKIKFTVGEGEEAVEYSGEHQTINNVQIFKVSHSEEGQVVTKTIIVPATNYGIYDHHILYQEIVQTNDHDPNYTYASAGKYYSLRTHLVDLSTGEDVVYDFPFLISNFFYIADQQKIGEVGQLTKYAIAIGNQIENKQLQPTIVASVIDSGLVFHDVINNFIMSRYVKLGNGYYDTTTKELLDTDKVSKGTVKDGIEKICANGILVYKDSYYGVINEKGEYVFRPNQYNSYQEVNSDVIYLTGVAAEPMLFNLTTLEDVTPNWDTKKTYNKSEIGRGYYVEKGDTEVAGSKDKVYYLGNLLESVEIDSSLAVYGGFNLNLGGMGDSGTSEFEIVRYLNEEGDTVRIVYRSDVVQTAFGA